MQISIRPHASTHRRSSLNSGKRSLTLYACCDHVSSMWRQLCSTEAAKHAGNNRNTSPTFNCKSRSSLGIPVLQPLKNHRSAHARAPGEERCQCRAYPWKGGSVLTGTDTYRLRLPSVEGSWSTIPANDFELVGASKNNAAPAMTLNYVTFAWADFNCPASAPTAGEHAAPKEAFEIASKDSGGFCSTALRY